MLGNEFWRQVEITPDMVCYESSLYMVVVTPRLWREQARSETDRNLCEYSVVNKAYGCVEASSNNITAALIMAKSFQEQYTELKKEEKTDATIIGFPSKDRT